MSMNYRKFVDAWLDAYNKQQGVPAVASKMEIAVSTASAKANYLRRQGVKLPIMPRTRAPLNTVEELNELIASKL